MRLWTSSGRGFMVAHHQHCGGKNRPCGSTLTIERTKGYSHNVAIARLCAHMHTRGVRAYVRKNLK